MKLRKQNSELKKLYSLECLSNFFLLKLINLTQQCTHFVTFKINKHLFTHGSIASFIKRMYYSFKSNLLLLNKAILCLRGVVQLKREATHCLSGVAQLKREATHCLSGVVQSKREVAFG